MERRIQSQSGIAYQWDERKAAQNRSKHGVSFEAALAFDWTNSVTLVDDRRRYGERRYVTYGAIGDRLYALVWTQRADTVRVISLRRANQREFYRYG